MTSSPSRFDHELLLRKVLRMRTMGRVPAFFFDFDGTLVNIVPTAEEVRMEKISKQVIGDLAEKFPLGIISGRKLDELRKLVGMKNIFYSGNHGVEIEGPGLNFVEPRSARSSPFITSLGKEMHAALGEYRPRINLKKYSVSVHYRTVEPLLVRKLLSGLNEILREPLRERKIEVFHGKKVVEIKAPVDWDKGKAIEMIARKVNKNCLPVFFGDDTTDEYGFKTVNAMHGVSVFVGKRHRKTHARYWTGSPTELVGELAKFLFAI